MIKNFKLNLPAGEAGIKNLPILLVFIFALSLRLYGLNWDQGTHLHPDERFLTMVASDIRLPSSISQYFDTQSSPLNPGNYSNYQFFVYGTFPLFVTKIFAVIFSLDGYDKIHFVGRILSAFFDAGIVFLLYKLTKKFLAPILYATTVLPIQLSHFYAVDTFLSFFILLTFYLLTQKRFISAGFAFGLALACKISALYFLPIIGLYLLFYFYKNIPRFFLVTIYLFLVTFLSFRIFQPYAFVSWLTPNPVFIDSLKQLQSMSSELSIYFPPSVQWMNKIKIIFPLQNIIFFGLGLPLSLSFIFIKNIKLSFLNILSLIWIGWLILYQGTQDVFSMRYFLPICPFVILILSQVIPPKFIKLILIPHLVTCYLFLVIYSVPHSRVQATNWINQNISLQSTLSAELWDDALPLNNLEYKIETLEITGSDTSEKWQKINQQLTGIDYIILSSNRSWASVTTVPQLLPQTNLFYRHLFSQKPIIEINSYPGFRLPIANCYYFGPTNMPHDTSWFAKNNCPYPGVYFRDDLAEEAFSVYDHPKVLIFNNHKSN